jgi:hypothetical protein
VGKKFVCAPPAWFYRPADSFFYLGLSYGQHRHVIYYYIFVYVRCALPLRAARLLALAAA